MAADVEAVEAAADQLLRVVQAEDELRGLLDEILASRRALDRGRLGRLEALLGGPAAQALDALDALGRLEVTDLLAVMARCPVAVR